MTKQLFIENSPFLTRLSIADDLKESMEIKQGKNNTLIVKNVPATILNRGNQNGRIYSTEEMQKALDAAKQQISTKQLLCQASEHPEGSFVSPTHASHVILNAYIKENVKLEVEGEKGTWDVLFCDIEVLNTQEGQNLQALLLSGCSVGTSIRGLGDMQGDKVINYEFLGFDIVSNPSSGTFTNMPIYEAKIESIDERKLDEATRYTISTYASNTTHDLQQAVEFQNNAAMNVEYGTITDIGTKMDQEVDPKTGVEKIVGEVEVETSDDTSDLNAAIQTAINAFNNPNNVNVTSITIEKVDDDDIKDSVESTEEALQEDNDEIKVNGDEVVTTLDGEEYKKKFQDPAQAKIAASGVENGKLNPAVILPEDPEKNNSEEQDTYLEPMSDSVMDEDAQAENEEMQKVIKQFLDDGNNQMALAFAKALNNKQSKNQDSNQALDSDTEIKTIKNNNETFTTNDEKDIPTGNVNNNNVEPKDGVGEPLKLDSAEDPAVENLYTNPDQASDDLVEPEKQPMSDNVIIELNDISYDIDGDDSLQDSTQEEYESILEALESLPESIEVKVDASQLQEDNIMETLLQKAKEQTGLPIKDACIVDVRDADQN